MKTKRFDFNFAPLKISHGLLVEGSVPAKQSYSSDEDEYMPDYKLTPLVILPFVRIIDKDGVLTTGNVNSQLSNIVWTEYDGNSKKIIESSNTDYTITTQGDEKGKLIVRRNASEGVGLTLEFTADYYDTRTRQVTSIQDSILVTCKNASSETPVLTLTADDTTLYNPLRDTTTQSVEATLMLGKKECPTENRLFTWDVMRDGVWVELGSYALDYFATVSDDTTTLTLNKDLMGEGMSLRCRAKYSAKGTPSSVTLGEDAPTAIANFVRRIPTVDYEIIGVPTSLPGGTEVIYPLLSVRDAKGVLENPEKELQALWYVATNKISGTLIYTQVDNGYAPSVPTTYLDAEYGAVLGVELNDMGAWKAWTDSDDAVLTDDEGKAILIK